MRKLVYLAALAGLAIAPQARAQVVPGSTFSIAVVGFTNLSAPTGSFLTNTFTPVFGTTATFPNGGLGGQTVTVASSEAITPTTVTDTVTISVPTNFAPTGTTVGSPAGPVEIMEADLGAYNASGNPIQLLFPEPSLATSGVTASMLYSGGSFDLSSGAQASVVLTNGNMAVGTGAGVNAGGSDLAPFTIHSFTISFSYPLTAVPEPGSMALCGFALAGIPAWLRRRRRTA